MIGLLLLILTYRYYANLAKKYSRVRWQYGVLGMAIFMIIQMVLGGIYGAYLAIVYPGELEEESSFVGITPFNIFGWAVAGLTLKGVHKVIEQKLMNEAQAKPSIEIDLIGKKEFE